MKNKIPNIKYIKYITVMKINIKCNNFFFLNILIKILLNSFNSIKIIKKSTNESIK